MIENSSQIKIEVDRMPYFGNHILHSCKFCVKCLDSAMMRQIFCALLVPFLFTACENRYRKGGTSSSSHSSVDPVFVGKTSDDAYQVAESEYDDNFISRYGLLYLKSSNDPFTGRILTVSMGDSGEFVSADESWIEGKKHGKSSKWFSNGIKMYERNYKNGRWHGSVTRWWPNGQKMYVRGYTNGVRHGKEATWRSDGSPLSLPADGSAPAIELSAGTENDQDSLPSVDLVEPVETFEPDPPVADFELDTPVPDPGPLAFPPVADPSTEAIPENTDNDFSDLPSFPPMEDEALNSVDGEDFPALPEPSVDVPVPVADGLPDLPAGEPSLPELSDDASGDLPALPGLDQSDPVGEAEPLPLPGLPEETDSGGLPPLPASDEGFGDLPPLPPLP